MAIALLRGVQSLRILIRFYARTFDIMNALNIIMKLWTGSPYYGNKSGREPK